MNTTVMALLLAGATGLGSGTSTVAAPADPPFVVAQADCSGAARRAARQTGGEVLAARSDGRGACEVTLLVPRQGGRPRRVVVTVPA